MTSRTTYHLTPYVNGWQVKGEGDDAREVLVDNKDDALRHAKELAKSHELSQVIVHKGNGQIEEEFTYGEDPAQSKG